MKKLIFIIIIIAVVVLGLYLWRFGLTIPNIANFSTEEPIPQPPQLPE